MSRSQSVQGDHSSACTTSASSWSIHAEIHSSQRTPSRGINVLTFQDSAWGNTAELTEDEAAEMAARLPPGATLLRLERPQRRRTKGPSTENETDGDQE
jgi:hypothetical protein